MSIENDARSESAVRNAFGVYVEFWLRLLAKMRNKSRRYINVSLLQDRGTKLLF